MVKRKDAGTRKYGMPLYCAAWPQDQFVYVAGGGGKKGSGISNRIAIIKLRDEELSDEVGELKLGEDCPLRMVAHPSGNCLVLAIGGGGLMQVDIDTKPRVPLLTRLAGEAADELRRLGEVKCLAFSGDGRLLALGGEDGSIQVLEWPSLRSRIRISGEQGLQDALRDLDFSPAHHHRLLASCDESGACVLWKWEQGLRVAVLDLPLGLEKGSFNRCRFARDGTPSLFTVVNAGGAAHVLAWGQSEVGEMLLRRQARVHNAPVTALDISPDGLNLGMGTSEGEVVVVGTEKLGVVRRVAGAHMVFATAVALSPDGGQLLSVSADASARVTPIRAPNFLQAVLRSTAFIVVVIAVLLALLLQQLKGLRDVVTGSDSLGGILPGSVSAPASGPVGG